MSAAVVKLPTAAARKVKQTAKGKPYLAALEGCARFPLEPRFEASPYVRKCHELARRMYDAGNAAALQLALALCSTAPADQQARLTGRLLALKIKGYTGADEALAWLEYDAAPMERKSLIATEFARLLREGDQ